MEDPGLRRPARDRRRLAKLSTICLAMAGAVRENCHDYTRFSVGKKPFAYYLNDHHGDGIISVCCKVLPGDNERLIAASPRKFYMPAYIGPRGWVALRLDRATLDWKELKELIEGSYAETTAKKKQRPPRRNGHVSTRQAARFMGV